MFEQIKRYNVITEDNMQDLLTIENIAKDYNGINVINDISISVKPGEIIGLLAQTGQVKQHFFILLWAL